MHVVYFRFAATAGIALAVGWVAGDLARRAISVLLTGMDFPWLQLAAPLTAWPGLVQAADVLGATGISGLVALVNGSLCDFVLARGLWAKARACGVTTFTIALVLVYGEWRLSYPDSRPGPRVALVPWNSLPPAFDASRLRGMADVLLWSEGVIEDDGATDKDRVIEFERCAAEANAVIVIGWHRRRPTFTANSIAIAHPSQGLIQIYEKTYLVPWSEFSPTAGLSAIVRPASFWHSGEKRPTFLCAATRVAPAICYDVCFPGLYRQFDAPDVFVVCSSETADERMLMQEHILQMVRLRAIEFRRPIVRNVRGGHSGIIDSCGRVRVDIVDPREPVAIGPVPIDERDSIYAATGDAVLAIPLAVLVAVCLYRNRRRRRRTGRNESA